jgi:hypothetical protein
MESKKFKRDHAGDRYESRLQSGVFKTIDVYKRERGIQSAGAKAA